MNSTKGFGQLGVSVVEAVITFPIFMLICLFVVDGSLLFFASSKARGAVQQVCSEAPRVFYAQPALQSGQMNIDMQRLLSFLFASFAGGGTESAELKIFEAETAYASAPTEISCMEDGTAQHAEYMPTKITLEYPFTCNFCGLVPVLPREGYVTVSCSTVFPIPTSNWRCRG